MDDPPRAKGSRPAPWSGAGLAPGQAFGRYRIERNLGEGACGVVYLARDERLARPVALKLLKAGAEPRRRARFLREARAAAGLSHPNLVGVHDTGELEGVPYLVMDAVEGVSLSEYAARAGTRAFLGALEQVARAVGHAHGQGICHRDLKPENVLVTRDGTPVVTDFGLALAFEAGDEEQQRLTQTGQALGTPLYMSPEQLVGDRDRIGPPSDVWSLGVILYEQIAGAPPFWGASFAELQLAVLRRPLRPPSRLQRGLHPDLDTICARALAKSPADRFADGEAFAEQLALHLAGEPLTIRPLSLVRRLWRDAARSRGTLLPAALVLGSLGLAAAAWLPRLREPVAPGPVQTESSPAPSSSPAPRPSDAPSGVPSGVPTDAPSGVPTDAPTGVPTDAPSAGASPSPTAEQPWEPLAATRPLTELLPAYLHVDRQRGVLRDVRRGERGGHPLLVQGSARIPRVVAGPEPYLECQAELSAGVSSSRSEVRLLGADMRYCDSELDPVFHTAFELFVPPDPSQEALSRERTQLGDWRIVWQCGQIGAAPPHYYRVTSPPLSLQLYGQRLFLRTYSDYARYARDLPDDELFAGWERRRSPSEAQRPELGEQTRDGSPAAIERRALRYAGYVTRGAWCPVVMSFRLGARGFYRIQVGEGEPVEFHGSIGYRSADDPHDPNPVVVLDGHRRIKKRASVRFGLYQGYGDPDRTDNPATRARVRYRRFAFGSDEASVRGR